MNINDKNIIEITDELSSEFEVSKVLRKYPKDTVIPQNGVYISRTTVGDNRYYSITNVGEKPTVSDENKNIETAIGEFSQDIYGEIIEVEFVKKIRNIEKFDSLSELKKQLETDMNEAKEYFEKRNENE